MRRAVVAVLVAVFATLGCPPWLADCHPLLRAASHHVFHANAFHLAVNCLSAWAVFAPGRGDNWRDLALALLLATAASLVSPRPAVGFSDVLYAVVGLRVPGPGWWRRREALVFLAVTAALAVVPGISAATHAAAFALGAAAGAARRRIHKAIRSYERIGRIG